MSRQNSFAIEDGYVYWDISIYDIDGTALDADANPTVKYRSHNNDTLKTGGITVTKVAATTGLYKVRFDFSADSDLSVNSSVRIEETATISGTDYVNRWATLIRVSPADKPTLDEIEDKVGDIDVATTTIESKTSQLTFTVANQVDANSLTGGTSPSAVADAVWDEAASGHNVGGSFGKFIRQMKEGLIVEEASVDDSSATTTSFITTLPKAVDEFYNDDTLVFISGNLVGQSRIIQDYDGSALRVTFDEPLTSAPADTDEFILLAGHNLTLSQIENQVWNAVEANHQIAGSTGKALTDASATGGDATAANQQEILTRLSNPIVRVHQDEFGLGFLQLFSNADYDDIAHKRKRWLVDVADTNLTGFDTGALVITDTRTQTVQVTITDCTVNDAGTPSLQGVSVGLLQANTASLSVGLKYDFKLTMVKSGSNQRFVVDEGRLEMLR